MMIYPQGENGWRITCERCGAARYMRWGTSVPRCTCGHKVGKFDHVRISGPAAGRPPAPREE